MSMGATLSILGLYNDDNTVFDLMSFPDGFTKEQKQVTIDNILIECAELEFLYASPVVAKPIIGIWSKKEKPYWDRIYKASQAEYNPIENYRRNETETVDDGRTEEHSGKDKTSQSGNNSLLKTGADSVTESGTETLARTGTDTNVRTGTESTTGNSYVQEEAGGDDRTDNNITGYDSNTLVPHDETEVYYGKTVETRSNGSSTLTHNVTDTETLNTSDATTFGKTQTMQHNTSDTETFGRTDTLEHGEKIEHTGNSNRSMLAYGNIGVTTSQEMLTQEIELAKIIEVIPIIIDSFKNRFCLMVY